MSSTSRRKVIASSTPSSPARGTKARMSLGRQPPPKPTPALRNWRPIRASCPIASARSTTSAPVDLAHLGHRVDEGDLGGQEGVRGHLDQLGGREVGDHDRGAGVDQRRVDLAQHLLGAARSATPSTSRSGSQGVLDGEALAQELRVPGQHGVGAGRRELGQPRASRAAVPTGTVDLPTTSVGRVRCGASGSIAPSTWLQVGAEALGRLRRADADEVDVAERRAASAKESVNRSRPDATCVASSSCEAGLVERDPAGGQRLRPCRVDLDAEDLVARARPCRRRGWPRGSRSR